MRALHTKSGVGLESPFDSTAKAVIPQGHAAFSLRLQVFWRFDGRAQALPVASVLSRSLHPSDRRLLPHKAAVDPTAISGDYVPQRQAKATSAASAKQAPTPSSRNALLHVCDQVEHIDDSQQAYEALEQLITPAGLHDCQQMRVERRQMGSLLRALNRDMREQIDTARRLVLVARREA